MKILLTAKDSFVSKTILRHLSSKHQIHSFSKKELDLRNIDSLEDILLKNEYDFVINPAISGKGRLLAEDTYEDFYNNLLINENLLFCHSENLFRKLITFSSGAEFNRSQNIIHAKEDQIVKPPKSVYSLAKNINSKRVKNQPNIVNLRIFNLFGFHEREDRFISTNLKRYFNKENMQVWGDAYFDFFGEYDFIKILEHCLGNINSSQYMECNLVYKEKLKLTDICQLINQLDEHKVDIILKPMSNNHYTGSCQIIENYFPKLNGLKTELELLYNDKFKYSAKTNS